MKFVATKLGTKTNFFFAPLICCCFWIRDPRSGSGMGKNQDPGWVKIRIRDPELTSRIRNTGRLYSTSKQYKHYDSPPWPFPSRALAFVSLCVFVKNLDRSRDLEREDEEEEEEEDEDDDLFRSFFRFCFRSRLFRFLKDREDYNSLSTEGSLACNVFFK